MKARNRLPAVLCVSWVVLCATGPARSAAGGGGTTRTAGASIKVLRRVEITRSGAIPCQWAVIGRTGEGVLVVTFGMSRDEPNPENAFGGTCLSYDGGKTWTHRQPRGGWQYSHCTLKDGRLLQMDMWSAPLQLGNRRNHHVNVHLFSPDGKARETRSLAPIQYDRDVDVEHWHFHPVGPTPGRLQKNIGFQIDGQIVQMPDESLLATAYGGFVGDHDEKAAGPNRKVSRTILLRSTDLGRRWKYYSTVAGWFDLPEGRRGHGPEESGLERLADGRLLAIFRTQSGKNFFQCWSSDGGRAWTKPTDSGVGSVEPALLRMSNGILACSYGRPDYRLMLSLDGTGKTWTHHTVIEPGGDGTTGIVEIAPNQLAYSYQSRGAIWVAVVEVKKAEE